MNSFFGISIGELGRIVKASPAGGTFLFFFFLLVIVCVCVCVCLVLVVFFFLAWRSTFSKGKIGPLRQVNAIYE